MYWIGTRMFFRVAFAFMVFAIPGAIPARNQIDPDVLDQVIPAAVKIGLMVDVTENGTSRQEYIPVGSGTIVSPDGLVLTNWHVVDMAAHRTDLDAWEAGTAQDGTSLTFRLDQDNLAIFRTMGTDEPEFVFRARTVAEHHALDLAVLQITADAYGRKIEPAGLNLPYVPLGNSSSLMQGDPIHIFGYPAMGGGTLQYTAGVVSGFGFEEQVDDRAWINTDATMAGGSSGGTAVDDVGRLIGVPTQGSQLDCRPGDTNRDGLVDAQDVGCIPVGGSFGELRPINLALDILAHAGLNLSEPQNPQASASQSSGGIAAAETTISLESTPPLVRGFTPETTLATDEDLVYCATSPLYPPGTKLELPRRTSIWGPRHGFILPGVPVDPPMEWDPITEQLEAIAELPAGTIVEVTGPHVELGVCDAWPFRYQSADGAVIEGYLDEKDLRGTSLAR